MRYQADRRYDQLVADLAVSKELDAQIVRMMQYLKAHPEDVHRDALETRLEAASREMEKRDYEKTVLDVSRLSVDEKYENKALSLYTAFLAKYPNSRYAKQIQEAIGGIRQLLGSAYFEALKKRPPADFMARYAAYQAYLDQFPDSNERQAIVRMIGELADAYADAIAHQAASCDEKAHWHSCIAECDRFLSVLADKPAAERVRQLRATLLDKQELTDLIAEASRVADDWNKARNVYLDYLKKRPDTTQRAAVEARIAEFDTEVERKARWDKTAAFANDARQDIHARIKRLERFLASQDVGPYAAAARELRQRLEPERQRVLQDQELAKARQQALARQQAEAARQEKALQRIRRLRDQAARQLRPVAGRFKDNGDGTVFDRKTGLTWCLLDSKMETGTCMKYRTAQAYVGRLTTGGHSDWRLPNAGELATLYKNTPFFPGSGSAWYWTSESFVRGYHRVVDVVTTTPETVFTRVSKSEENCGAVRAVRR
ncbi:DUF1566 domain-containing protein [Desulfosarcina cetonica]|uniref:Lcl C-terminal domain-containing protein n=1 Tax=Desulfosarcina cetonica TaxID=90730 RepID=UPI00278C3BC9|nr:DUF1566 domain-containing protein [Desulfosarcina cetonica]